MLRFFSCLLMAGAFALSSSAAEVPASAPAAGTLTGICKADAMKVRQRLGAYGCLLIRSQWRWDEVRSTLKDLGWEEPADHPLAKSDFDKQVIVCVFETGDEDYTLFFSAAVTKDAGTAHVPVYLGYGNYRRRAQPKDMGKFILIRFDLAARIVVTVSSHLREGAADQKTPEKSNREWEATFTPDSGDIASGLTATIQPKAQTINPGDDVLIKFQLSLANAVVGEGGPFAKSVKEVSVWDGKYSNGYRNHAFAVTTPDGKTAMLQRKVVLNWDKNAPHLVSITADKPYVLPNWAEGESFKSLKGLGLDTSQPGRYTITGLYAQSGGDDVAGKLPWSGQIATNTVVIEVAAPQK